MVVNSCCVFGCTSSTATHPHFAFFSFPNDDESSEIWLKAIDLQNEGKDKTALRVCQLHFESSYILSTSKLDNNAVPTLHLPKTAVAVTNRCFKQEPIEVIVKVEPLDKPEGEPESAAGQLPFDNLRTPLLDNNEGPTMHLSNSVKVTSRCFKKEPIEIIVKEEPKDESESESSADGWSQSTIYKQYDTKSNILFAEKYLKLTTSPSEIISIEPSSKNLTHLSCSTQTDTKKIESSACQTAARLYDNKTLKHLIPSKFGVTPQKFKNFNDICDQYLNEKLAKLVKIQALLKYKPRGNKYTKEYKSFCSNMRDSEPLLYDQLQEFLTLPSTRTLRRLKQDLRNVPESGENNDFNSNTQATIITSNLINMMEEDSAVEQDSFATCSNINQEDTRPLTHSYTVSADHVEEIDFKCSNSPNLFNTMIEDSAVNEDSVTSCNSNQQDTQTRKRIYNTISADASQEDDDENNVNSSKVKTKAHLDPYYDDILNVILEKQSNFLTSLNK